MGTDGSDNPVRFDDLHGVTLPTGRRKRLICLRRDRTQTDEQEKA